MGDFAVPYIIMVLPFILIWTFYRLMVRKKHKVGIFREVVINLFFIYFLAVIYFTFLSMGC